MFSGLNVKNFLQFKDESGTSLNHSSMYARHRTLHLKDFMKNGWDSTIVNERSETLYTLRENMQGICGDFYRDLMETNKGRSLVTAHLNHLKVLGKTKT